MPYGIANLIPCPLVHGKLQVDRNGRIPHAQMFASGQIGVSYLSMGGVTDWTNLRQSLIEWSQLSDSNLIGLDYNED